MRTTETKRPTCSCGHDRYHHFARPDMRYGVGGWLNFFNGISAKPREIVFRCGKCGEAFETTRDPAVLHAFRRYPNMDGRP
jgi:hypothetical protein